MKKTNLCKLVFNEFSNTFAIKLSLDMNLKLILKITSLTTLFFLIVSVVWVLTLRYVNPPFTSLMFLRYFFDVPKNRTFERKWKSKADISPSVFKAVVASEDQRFYQHNGFDFEAIKKAMLYNEKKHKNKKVRGASTISQQVAKNVFLFPSRTWFRKGLEVYFTVLIETFWSKERILEIYVNMIEMGNGIYGVEAASRHYFKKSAKQLSQSESAMLASILPAPRKWSPVKPTPRLIKHQQWVLRQMNNLTPSDDEDDM